MPVVFLPQLLRPLAGGAASVPVEGATLREAVASLERLHPALKGRIVDADGLRPEVFLAVGGEEAFGLDQAVAPEAEVHVMPAMAGGGLPVWLSQAETGITRHPSRYSSSIEMPPAADST